MSSQFKVTSEIIELMLDFQQVHTMVLEGTNMLLAKEFSGLLQELTDMT